MHMSRIARKPTKWHMRKAYTRISLGSTHMPIRADTFRFLLQESLLYTTITHRREISGRIRLCGLRKVIRVDTLRICHIVGFLAMRLICTRFPAPKANAKNRTYYQGCQRGHYRS